MTRIAIVTALCALTAAQLAPSPSRAQQPDDSVLHPDEVTFYQATGSTKGLVSLELLPLGTPFGETLVTLLNRDGSYQVFYGYRARGGLNIFFARIRQVADPFTFLRDLEGDYRGLDCEIDFFGREVYGCRGPHGGATGRLLPLRTTPGYETDGAIHPLSYSFYEATDDATGWKGELSLEILPTDAGAAGLATLYNDDGRYRVFYGPIRRGILTVFYAQLREVANPFVFLRDLEGPLLDVQCQFPVLSGNTNYFCRGAQGESHGRLRILRQVPAQEP